MIIHIRNFGKIESADIDLNNLVIFVGENNSGKTYIMQLIYGLFSFFYSTDFNSFLSKFDKLSINDEKTVVKNNNTVFYEVLQDEFNSFLNENKDLIIENTFHTRNLSINSLSVEFKKISDDISLVYQFDFETSDEINKKYLIKKNKETVFTIAYPSNMPDKFIKRVVKRQLLTTIFSELTGLRNLAYSRLDEKAFIYLPASRSGMMLLYANYLANDVKKDFSKDDGYFIEKAHNTDTENEYGLTEPIYNFLMFLLKHKNSEIIPEYNKDIISFINDFVINGSFEKIGTTMRYKPSASDQSIPIYLSSSLVSELAPIYQILSGIQRYNYIMYDEIETCQHPTKQLQLARLLVRMVNAGYKMIVSTHSDTMALAINNLITLSFKKGKNSLLEKLGYEEKDLLKSANVKAYQFLIGETGKTIIQEIPSHFSVGIGFDFNLFNRTNDKIYQDAVALAEVE